MMKKTMWRTGGVAIAVLAMGLWVWPVRAEEVTTAQDENEMEEIVVTATKTDRKIENLTDSVTVISEDEIRERGYTDFTEVLRFTPGVEFKQAGGPGQFNYPRLRGYGSGHFLMLIDGMKINEGIGGDVGYLLGQFDPSLIGSTEILRGPQSALYGSSTTAGVMSITTKGGVEGTHVNAGAEYGSLDWKRGFASLRGGTDEYGYALNFAATDSDGVQDCETYDNISPHAKFSFKRDGLEAEASFLYMKTRFNSSQLGESYDFHTDESDYWSFQTADPRNENQYEHYLGTLNFRHQLTEKLRQKLTLGWYKKEDRLLDEYDGLLGRVTAPYDGFTLDYGMTTYNAGDSVPIYDDGTGVAAHYRNENLMADYNFIWDQDIGDTGANTLLFGYEYEKKKGKKWGVYGDMKANTENHSFYVNDQLLLMDEALVLSGGLRQDEHDTYGSETTGKTGLAYTFRSVGTTFFSNYGTSFRAPTFSNLFDPTYGNPDVEPEEGWTTEFGMRQDLFHGKANFEVTYWHSELDNVIVYDWQYPRQDGVSGTGAYTNRDEGETEGVEFAFGWHISDALLLSGNYTYCDSWSKEDDETSRTVLVARNKANLDLSWTHDRLYLNLHTYYAGPRLRWNGDLEMDEYVRVDVAGRYKLGNGFSVYSRIENLFDDKTEEALGYEQPGIYAIAGLEWNFDL